MVLLPVQCRMARAALDWSIRDLAETAKVGIDTVTRFEKGETLKERTVEALQHTLEAAGVEFIPENGGGPGVRLRKPVAKSTSTSKPATGTKTAPPKKARRKGRP